MGTLKTFVATSAKDQAEGGGNTARKCKRLQGEREMKRQEKYPETSTFHYFNANPHNRKSGDCVIRAICTALEQSWEQTVMELTEIGLKYGYVANDLKTVEKYLAQKGWTKHKQPRKADNTKYTGKEFCELISKRFEFFNKAVIANIGGLHMVCIKAENAISNHKVYDIWDSTGGCIGNYWVKGTIC